MRKIIILLFFALVLSGAVEKPSIELKTVYEKTFDDTIVDMIFDTVTVTLEEARAIGWRVELFSAEEKAKGKVTILYPCVLITKDEIRFLDVKGKKKKSIKRMIEGVKWEGKGGIFTGKGLIKVRKSKNGEYLAVAIPRGGSVLGEGIKGDLVMYRKDGKEMWRLADVYLSDGYVTPSPDGRYAIALPPEEYPAGAPAFYSKEGMSYLKVKEWKNGWKRGYAVGDFDFSDDGRYLVIGIYNFPVRDSGFVILFDSKGREIWEICTGKGVSYVRISNSGKYIAVVATDRGENADEDIMIFSKKGSLLWEKNFSHWDGHTLMFDPNKDKLCITWYHGKVRLRIYETKTGKELWKFYSEKMLKDISFVDVLFSKSSLYLFLIGSGGSKDALYTLSLDGKILQKTFYKNCPFTMQNYISEGNTMGIQIDKWEKDMLLMFAGKTLTVKVIKEARNKE